MILLFVQMHPFYNLKRRVIAPKSSLYKLKRYDENSLLFSVPDESAVAWVDCKLESVQRVERYSSKPLAIDFSEEHIVAGCQDGKIMIRERERKENEDESEEKGEMILNPQSADQQFINDILHLANDPSRIINCYNNGLIAMWNIKTGDREADLKIHEKYTYKLRLQNETTLISCGADGFVVRTDLEEWRSLGFFPHPESVWCADRVDNNCIASVGIFRRVFVWDVRCRRAVQQCFLRNSESSFVTTYCNDGLYLLFGDGKVAKKWDRRTSQCQRLCEADMIESAQGMVVDESDIWICGRGSDLCHFSGSVEKEEQPSIKFNLDLVNKITRPEYSSSQMPDFFFNSDELNDLQAEYGEEMEEDLYADGVDEDDQQQGQGVDEWEDIEQEEGLDSEMVEEHKENEAQGGSSSEMMGQQSD